MRISNSQYISFIDSDDGWTSDKLKEQIHYMEKNPICFAHSNSAGRIVGGQCSTGHINTH